VYHCLRRQIVIENRERETSISYFHFDSTLFFFYYFDFI